MCERVIGTIRRECLDRMLILRRRHLEAALADTSSTTTPNRPHWSLSQRAPCTLDTVPALIGDVDVAQLRRTDRLDALMHEYPHGRPSWADGVLGPLRRMGSRAHSSVGGAAPGEASTCLLRSLG
jgi:hypothetical protein